jgi:hypothetical protein
MSESPRPISPLAAVAKPSESPQRSGQIGHRGDAGVPSESKGQIFVAAGLEQGERPFEVIPRLAILAGEPASVPGGALRDARLGRIGSCLDVPEESRSVPPHRWQVATHVAAAPHTVVGRQSSGRILVARRRDAGSGEGFGRFRRAVAPRLQERVAVSRLQLRQSPPLPCIGLTSSVVASAASSVCASAISGISGVGVKPSSAGARTACASAGRAVRR